MTSVLIVGSVALDTIETPHGKQEEILGGSATHFCLAASRFAPVRLVGVVGRDFPDAHVRMLRSNKVDTEGLEVADGKTFRWHGRYKEDMNQRDTISVELNVLGKFEPKVPASYAETPYVLLGNSVPATQKAVLGQLKGSKFVMLDTMDLWIETARDEVVDLLPRVSALCINHEEALQLAGTMNTAKAVRKLLDMGVRTLIVKRGEHGATLATREFQFSVPAYPTDQVVDPTGAGDAFAGGMLGYLAEQQGEVPPLRRALIHGSVMGSFTVEKFGTKRLQEVSRKEIDARAKALVEMITV